MTLSHLVDQDVQLSLIAATGHPGLAAELLTKRFGLSHDYAELVLDQGYGLLIARLDRQDAHAALPLMSSLGLRVAIQPCESLPPDEVCDVSIRISERKYAKKLIVTLGRLIGLSGLEPASFCGPEGLVIGSMTLAKAERLGAALRKLNGVSAALSDHQTARYDLFAEAELSEEDIMAVSRHLRLLGSSAGGMGDALGNGLDRRVLDMVLNKFPDLGLFGANQLFQRHELLIIGKGTLSQQEFVDFLVTRQIAQSVPTAQLLRTLPLRVESFLTRSAANQFLADYTAIGMQAITRLVHRADLLEKSP
jgi:hypothetical protein